MEKGFEGKNKTETETIVENTDLDISYVERVIELPLHRQEETGLTRIRRRTISKLPAYFGTYPLEQYPPSEWGSLDEDKCLKCFDFLCNGRLLGQQTFIHTFLGDHLSGGDLHDKVVKQFVDDGLYFQSINAVDDHRTTKNDYSRFHSSSEGVSVFDFSVSHSWPYSGAWAKGLPIFAFGSKNKVFVEYLEKIITNSETRALLKNAGWDLGHTLQVIAGDLDVDKKRALLESESLKKRLEAQPYRFEGVEIERMIKEKHDILVACGDADELDDVKNVEILEYLMSDTPFEVANWNLRGSHPHIPIINHPDIKPLLWCHAEVAIIPTNKSLNILFFEKD